VYRPEVDRIGKTVYEVFPPEQATLFAVYIQRALNLGHAVNLDYSLPVSNDHQGQQQAWFSAMVSPLPDHRVIWVSKDITARKHAETSLRQRTKKEQLIASIALQIHQSLQLPEVLNTVVVEVRKFLQTDRVLIYSFYPDWSGRVITESVCSDYQSVLNANIHDPCFGEYYAQYYQQGRIRAIENVYSGDLTPCHVDFLAQFQVVANLIVPILQGDRLWGLLIAHHCRGSRQWQHLDIELLQQLATQMAIATQQSELYQQAQNEIAERKQAETALSLAQERSENLLLSILPKDIAEQLKENPKAIAESFDDVTILFSDIVNFTPLAANLPPTQTVDLLNQIFSRFDHLAQQYGLEKIKTIGDAYMVVGGLPKLRHDHVEAVIEMALGMQQEILAFERTCDEPFQLRIGINTGPVVAGVIGTQKFTYDLWGDAVNVAARMEAQGTAGKIQVTDQTYERVKDCYRFEQRGNISVKGRGEIITYWLIGRNGCLT